MPIVWQHALNTQQPNPTHREYNTAKLFIYLHLDLAAFFNKNQQDIHFHSYEELH